MDDFPTVDVDHARPLSMGGTDTDGNAHVFCRGCHQLKTATEFGASGLPDFQTPPAAYAVSRC
ncbi:HNH endonuclease [Streptomyces sp. NPDC058877]|uniref:HNH endonuclease n=1 Tax=Streptomyces sp. NPDC058877 TaxID=3346665 RepID=UPI00368152E4